MILGQHTMVMRDMKHRLGELVAAGSMPDFYLDPRRPKAIGHSTREARILR